MLKSVKITYFEITFSETFSLHKFLPQAASSSMSRPTVILTFFKVFSTKLEAKQNKNPLGQSFIVDILKDRS